MFERKEELLKALDPKKWKKRKKKREEYNKEYYRKNRERIRVKQQDRYQKRKAVLAATKEGWNKKLSPETYGTNDFIISTIYI